MRSLQEPLRRKLVPVEVPAMLYSGDGLCVTHCCERLLRGVVLRPGDDAEHTDTDDRRENADDDDADHDRRQIDRACLPAK